jgi:hypothetical protein
MIKLYIFESPDELKLYEASAAQNPKRQPEREDVHDYPVAPKLERHYKKRSKVEKSEAGLCFCGRPANHRGMHRGGKRNSARKKMEKRPYQPPEVETAPTTKTDDELRQEVRDLQREGYDSLKIAAKLKISLREVNKYWDFDIATDNGTEEEADDKNL